MNKLYLSFAAAFLAAGAMMTTEAQETVERVKTALDFKKAAMYQSNKAPKIGGVTRVSEATVTLPWFENFEDEETFENFTVIDGNDDFATWEWYDGVAEYGSLWAEGPADDWLITPGFEMTAGKSYQISFRARSYDFESPEEFSAWLGTAPEAEAMTIEVVEKTTVAQDNFLNYDVTITAENDGVYYLGIHCTSDPEDSWSLDIDDISIKEAAIETAPGEVTDLKITPDPEGALKATITFTTPTVTTDGTALTALTKVEIYRNDVNLIKTFDSPATGEQLTYVDEEPSNGDNHYTITPYNEAGEGKSTKLSLFVGEDMPCAPKNITQKVSGTDVILTWEDEPLGWNGHYINTSKLKYNIWESNDGINVTEVAKGVTEKSYTIEGRAEQGKQKQTIFVVQAESSSSTGSRGYSNNIVLGKSDELPFNESFAEGKIHNNWFLKSDDSKDKAEFIDADQNGDGGAIQLSGHEMGCTVNLYSSKVWIKDEAKLKLSFWYRSPADGTLTVGLSKDFEELKTQGVDPSDEWKQVTMDLSDMTTNEYGQILFSYKSGAEPCLIDNVVLTSTTSGIDNILNGESNVEVIERYGIDGTLVTDDYRGVVIESLSDGTFRKNIMR